MDAPQAPPPRAAAPSPDAAEKPSEPLTRALWPGVPRGRVIADYSQWQLRSVIRWVKSDGLLHTEDELLEEAMTALGFSRKGIRIVTALRAAVASERGQP